MMSVVLGACRWTCARTHINGPRRTALRSPEVVTLTIPLTPVVRMLKFAVIVVVLTTTKLDTVTPPGGVIVAGAENPVPIKVTVTVVPCVPLTGVIEDSVGTGGGGGGAPAVNIGSTQ